MDSWWEIISVFLFSTTKFVFGAVPMALGLGFSFFESVTVTSLGGFTGVIVYVLMSDRIISNIKKRKAKKIINHPDQKAKKIFTRKNKIIVSVKRKFGLVGISFLTPLLLSMPIGCFLSVRYFKDKQRILMYMFSSVLFWSVTSYYIYKPIMYVVNKYFL